jgi:hypothetical protein
MILRHRLFKEREMRRICDNVTTILPATTNIIPSLKEHEPSARTCPSLRGESRVHVAANEGVFAYCGEEHPG